MKTKLVAALFSFALVFAACQKDPDETVPGSGTTTENYQPTTAGSTWQYNSSREGDYTEVALGTDSTISGQKFFKFDNSANGRRYVNNNGGIYTSYGYTPQIDTSLTLLYLKDAAVGTTWSNVGIYSGIPISLTYTVVSRGGEKVVNNNTFKNVIALDFAVTTVNPIGGQNLTVATGKQFYASGVGAILSTLHLDAAGIKVDDSTYLVSYDIK